MTVLIIMLGIGLLLQLTGHTDTVNGQYDWCGVIDWWLYTF